MIGRPKLAASKRFYRTRRWPVEQAAADGQRRTIPQGHKRLKLRYFYTHGGADAETVFPVDSSIASTLAPLR